MDRPDNVKVGDRFRVVGPIVSRGFHTVGDIVEVVEDDHSDMLLYCINGGPYRFAWIGFEELEALNAINVGSRLRITNPDQWEQYNVGDICVVEQLDEADGIHLCRFVTGDSEGHSTWVSETEVEALPPEQEMNDISPTSGWIGEAPSLPLMSQLSLIINLPAEVISNADRVRLIQALQPEFK